MACHLKMIMMNNTTEQLNLSNQAYASVSEMIQQRRLKGGALIVESRLADMLGISRTPLREALQRLEGEGLVIKGAGRSFIVRHVDLGEYLQSLKVREILEAEAVMLAIGRIPPVKIIQAKREVKELRSAVSYHTEAHWRSDDNVHGLYIDACGNEVMIKFIHRLRMATRLFEIAQLPDRVEPDSNEHLNIIDALENDDVKAACKAVRTHIKSLTKSALQSVSIDA